MSQALFAAVCAITPTRRRRFLWAAWWSAAPCANPFRKPDAFAGGARSHAEARSAAERAAGCSLLEIESSWARAWANVLVGKEPWPKPPAAGGPANAPAARAKTSPKPSLWQTLGLTAQASEVEIKQAYRQRALVAHPDRGGSAEAFRALHAAYESALERTRRPRARKKR